VNRLEDASGAAYRVRFRRNPRLDFDSTPLILRGVEMMAHGQVRAYSEMHNKDALTAVGRRAVRDQERTRLIGWRRQ
jgi:hypothetical protein